jgi:hypothetical protein
VSVKCDECCAMIMHTMHLGPLFGLKGVGAEPCECFVSLLPCTLPVSFFHAGTGYLSGWSEKQKGVGGVRRETRRPCGLTCSRGSDSTAHFAERLDESLHRYFFITMFACECGGPGKVATLLRAMAAAASPSMATSSTMKILKLSILVRANCPWPMRAPTPMARNSSSPRVLLGLLC